ncbi:MAG TPA: peptidoglycan-binding domain-containing protein [Solirubrobacteraceae bacterium]|nr:peptidoglycan-binding domain-containing protein [Solirubrobacteraceae bacterium]
MDRAGRRHGRAGAHARARLGALAALVVLVLALAPAGIASARLAEGVSPRTTAAQAAAVARLAVREAQLLFRQLGYPLGRERAGVLGTDTRGALSYFQRKYGLRIDGRPTAATLAKMRAVAASLRGAGAGATGAPPHDLVEDALGDGVPILGIAIGLALIVCALALSARERPRRRRTPAGGHG